MRITGGLVAAACFMLAGCGGGGSDEVAAPAVTVTATVTVTASPEGDEVPDTDEGLVGPVSPVLEEQQPAPAALVESFEGTAVPEGGLSLDEGVMAPHGARWVVAAVGTDDVGNAVRVEYLYAPFDQEQLDGSGTTEALNASASTYSPLLPVSEDAEARALAAELAVG